MKPDLYTRSLLTIAVVLLSVIAARPYMTSNHQVVHAAGPTAYDYTWFQLGFSVPNPKDGMEDITNQMSALSKKGWEIIAVMPVTGTRNDNIGTGTQGLMVILRKPK